MILATRTERATQIGDHVASKAPRFFTTKKGRLCEDFNTTTSQKRSATIEDWRGFGFSQLEKEGLGICLFNREENATIAQIKNAVSTPLDIMIVSLPHEGNPIKHTFELLSPLAASDLVESANMAAGAIEKVAARNGKELVRTYILQHIGDDEGGDFDHSTSFPQIHLHAIGVTSEDIEKANTDEGRADYYARRTNKYVFSDPMMPVIRDLFEESSLPADYDPFTSSFVLARRNDPLRIVPGDVSLVVQTMTEWRKRWKELAGCYTDFTHDANQRLLPLDKKTRIARVTEFFGKHPQLSSQSRDLLLFLAENLKDFDAMNPDTAFFNNIAGSLGWTIDYEKKEISLRVAPRTHVAMNKLGATDGFFMAEIDRSTTMPENEIEEILATQRQIFEEMRNLHR